MEIRSPLTVSVADAASELKKTPPTADKNSLAVKKVAREFESLMVNEMLKSMRATTGKDSLLSGGRGEEIYRSLLDQEYAQAIASQRTLGMAKFIEQQLIRTEKKPAVQPTTERRD
jgi:peptidoglycan hydrolase FlgJ